MYSTFLFQFSMIQLKVGRLKKWNDTLVGRQRKNDVTQQLQTKIFLNGARGFLFKFVVIGDVSLTAVII